jgi:ubiquinone/menaquinone biosynthesis C-methylase UbiE
MKSDPNSKEQMMMNWPERVWIYSPVRTFFLWFQAGKWKRLVGSQVVENALEIGCGLGRAPEILIKKLGFRQVIAFDIEEALINRAHRRRAPQYRDRVAFYVGDAQELPFCDSTFDAVVNYGIIHHVIDWRHCIYEISRVLKPGGMFYFEEIYPPLYANFVMKHVVHHPTQDRFNGRQFLDQLTANGLNLVDGVKTHSPFGVVGVAQKQ